MGDNYKRQSYSLTQDEFYIKVIGVRKEVPLEVTLEKLPFLLHTSPNLVPIGNAIQHKTEILLNEPLRSLPNGVKDEIVDNQLIRRVGKMSFSDLNKIKKPTTIVWGPGNSHGAYQWMSMASFNGTGNNIINYKHVLKRILKRFSHFFLLK